MSFGLGKGTSLDDCIFGGTDAPKETRSRKQVRRRKLVQVSNATVAKQGEKNNREKASASLGPIAGGPGVAKACMGVSQN